MAIDAKNVLAALRYPCLVDEQGNLHALRDDHAIVSVPGPGPDNDMRFWASSRSGDVSWAVGTRGLFVYIEPDVFFFLEAWSSLSDKFVLSPDFSRAHYVQESQD